MKILLACCFYMHNYGSQLQSIASYYILSKYSKDVLVVNCSNPKLFSDLTKYEYYKNRLLSKYSIQNQVTRYIDKIRSKVDKKYKLELDKRYHAFDEYINTHYSLTKQVHNKTELKALTQKNDIIVVGSDMLWNPINVDQNYYTLQYACDDIKKISFATSIGTSLIDKKHVSKYKYFLSRFDYISVREESAVLLINNILDNKKAELVLDPTLQLTRDIWDKMIDKSNNIPDVDESYIFAYFLGKNKEHRRIVKSFAKEKGLKILSIEHVDGFAHSDIGFGDEAVYNCNPDDFIQLIKYAKYVFTDSFHCCAFSIIYEKVFFVFDRFYSKDKIRNNTRIDNLLKMLHLQDRRVKSLDDIKLELDYTETIAELERWRIKSQDFLERALYDK